MCEKLLTLNGYCSVLIHVILVLNDASQDTKLVMEGRHNADKEWIAELRMKGDALVS